MQEKINPELFYKVFCTGGETYQIGAVINENEVVHGGNLHFVGKPYDTRQEALTALQEMMQEFVQENLKYEVQRISSARFLLGAKLPKTYPAMSYLPCAFPNKLEATETLTALKEVSNARKD